MTFQPPTSGELQELTAAIRRAALGRGLNRDDADDVAQETLSRMWAASGRLTPDARLPFALTTAANLIVDGYRHRQRDHNHRHRLLERDHGGPELDLIAAEQAAAVRAALDSLPHHDRQLVIDHADGSSTHALALASRSTPSAIAARLARTRARLRLDYLLALRRVELPSITCRRVLLAISAADLRRQTALNTAEHLGHCRTCTELVPPLAERRSRLAGIAVAPLIGLGTLGGWLHHALKTHAGQATAATAAVATGAAVAIAAVQPHAHRAASITATSAGPTSIQSVRTSPPAEAATLPAARGVVQAASGAYLLPLPASGTLRKLAGQRVVVSDMAVQSVASHPGFWIGVGTQRIYVHIADPAAVHTPIRVGQRVSFAAELEANPAGYAREDGVDTQEGSATLGQQGAHLTVRAADLIITVGDTVRASTSIPRK